MLPFTISKGQQLCINILIAQLKIVLNSCNTSMVFTVCDTCSILSRGLAIKCKSNTSLSDYLLFIIQ
jgi:hypothetical protein